MQFHWRAPLAYLNSLNIQPSHLPALQPSDTIAHNSEIKDNLKARFKKLLIIFIFSMYSICLVDFVGYLI